MNPIIDAEQSPRKEAYTMVYHFVRVEAADIRVSGVSEGQCLDKALAERQKQCRPSIVKGEVVE